MLSSSLWVSLRIYAMLKYVMHESNVLELNILVIRSPRQVPRNLLVKVFIRLVLRLRRMCRLRLRCGRCLRSLLSRHRAGVTSRGLAHVRGRSRHRGVLRLWGQLCCRWRRCGRLVGRLRSLWRCCCAWDRRGANYNTLLWYIGRVVAALLLIALWRHGRSTVGPLLEARCARRGTIVEDLTWRCLSHGRVERLTFRNDANGRP